MPLTARPLRRRYARALAPARPSAMQTRAVLGGAYKGKRLDLKALLTHTLDTDTHRALCHGVKPDHLADEYSGDTDAPPTCPRCLVKDPRFPSP